MGFSWLNLEKSQTSYIWPGPAGPGLKSGPGRARPNTQVPGRAGPTRLTLLYAQRSHIQNLDETEVAYKISAHLDLNWQSYSH